MRKILAVSLAALILLLPAAAVHTTDYTTEKVWMNRDEFIMCFDVVYLDGPDGMRSQCDLFGVSEGSAERVINEHPLYLSNDTAVVCYGWAGILKEGPVIALYGYKINEGSPVFDESFTQGAEQAVYNAGGDSRYRIYVPISDNKRPTLITLVTKGSDGVVRDMLEFSVNGEYVSPDDPVPVSPKERVFGEKDESKFNLIISGGTAENPVLAGSEFTAEIRLEGNGWTDSADLLIHYDPGLTYVSSSFPGNPTSAGITNDPATHTLRLSWSKASGIRGSFDLAELVFGTESGLYGGEFLHISADSAVSTVKYNTRSAALNLINGGADIIPYYTGDLDGDGEATNKDVVLLFRGVSTGGPGLTGAADVNNDGTADNKDVVTLFRAVSSNDNSILIPKIPTAVYSEITERVRNIRSWTFDDGTAGTVIGVYCETEPGAEVFVCDANGTVLLREHALYENFFGRFILPQDKTSEEVFIYAKSEGKAISQPSRPYTLAYGNPVGSGAFIGKDSHVYLNWYKEFYLGNQALGEQQLAGRMNNIKQKLYNKLDEVRARTKKNTKIIILVCTNPATVYHGLQYSEAEKGWGDHYEPTATTQLGEFLSDDKNIYMIDLRQILSEHTDQLLFMQADSHWTQIAAYYGYYLAAQKIQKDFPSVKVYDLEKDFITTVGQSGGDLLSFMGASGVRAVSASVTPKDESMKASSNAPTAYVMGDSYYGAFAGFLDLMFSDVYYNTFEDHPHPPLYDYLLYDLESRRPDYLFYIWTERNIDAAMSNLESRIIGEARG